MRLLSWSYIVDDHLVRKLDPSGNVTALAGTGFSSGGIRQGLATQVALTPFQIAVDYAGNVYVLDADHYIKKIDTTGDLTILQPTQNAYSLAVNTLGDVYFGTSNYKISKLPAGGGMEIPVIGNGLGTGPITGPAGLVQAGIANALAVDATGDVYDTVSQYRDIFKFNSSNKAARWEPALSIHVSDAISTQPCA